jgi:hypothetical protein
MNKLLTVKKYILFFIVVFAAGAVKAQSGYTFQQMGVGIDASYIKGYTNIQTQYSHPAFDINVIYQATPYLPFVAEFQLGTLSGGSNSDFSIDKYGRQYTNNYKAFIVHGDYQLGNDLDYTYNGLFQILKNAYIGTGLGFIMNSNTVQRTNSNPANGSTATSGPTAYIFPGTNNAISPVIPIRVGYEFKIYNYYNVPTMAVDLGYVHSFAFGEGLDGYNDPGSKFKNNAPDQYRQFVIGFKLFFGEPVPYNKLIRPFNFNY